MRQGPRQVGAYALLIRVPRQRTIRIGHLGPIAFNQGIYVYIGSALNSLEGRISRHFRATKRKHWHVDYLLDGADVGLVGVATRPTARRVECVMSRALQERAYSSIQGFGCSDCNCDSHLHYLRSLQRASVILSEVGFHYSESRIVREPKRASRPSIFHS